MSAPGRNHRTTTCAGGATRRAGRRARTMCLQQAPGFEGRSPMSEPDEGRGSAVAAARRGRRGRAREERGPRPKSSGGAATPSSRPTAASPGGGDNPPARPTPPPRPAPAPARMPAKVAYPLAFLSGFLYFLAFPGIDLWPLSFVALVPLIVALRGQTPRRALGLGWLAGFTMTMFGFYWLLEMLQGLQRLPDRRCASLFMAILCAYQAGRIALCGWLYGRAERARLAGGAGVRAGLRGERAGLPAALPLVLRGHGAQRAGASSSSPTSAARTSSGSCWSRRTSAVAELILARREERARSTARVARRGRRRAGAGGCSTAYPRMLAVDADGARRRAGEGRHRAGQPAAPRQARRRSRVHRQARPRSSRHAGRRARGVERGRHRHCANRETPDYDDVAPARSPAARRAHDLRRRSCSPRAPTASSYRYFNTALLADDGRRRSRGRYDKQYLLAFGEYLPFGDTFPSLTSCRRTRRASARARRSSPLLLRRAPDLRAHLLRGHPPRLRQRAWSATPTPICS